MGSSVWKALPWLWQPVTCFSVRKAVPVLLRPPPVLFLCRNLVHSSGSATASRFQNADLGDGKRCSTVRWSSPRSRIVGQPVCLRTNRRVQLTVSLSSRVSVSVIPFPRFRKTGFDKMFFEKKKDSFSEKRFHDGWPDYQLFLEPFAFFNYILYII